MYLSGENHLYNYNCKWNDINFMTSDTPGLLTIPYKFTPRPYQLELFRAMDGEEGKPHTKKNRAVLRWHRRAGKDKACFAYLIKEAAQTSGNYFYVFPTKTMARQALWENIDKDGFKLLDHIPKEFVARRSNQEMLLVLHNGSTIRVLGYDKDPDSIRGIACKGVVFSEFAFSDPESYKTMIPALRESEGWAIFNSTPNGRNHFYELWNSVVNSPRWFCSELQTYWPDKPGYSGLIDKNQFPEIIEEEGLTLEDVEREYGSSFNSGMQGSFYADQIQALYSENRVNHYTYDDVYTVDTFWDLGYNDSTAVWFRQKIGNKLVFIDYCEDSHKDIKFYVQMLASKGYKYGTHYLPHDGGNKSLQTGTTTSQLFEMYCKNYDVEDYVVILDRPKNKQDGINAVRSRFKRYFFDYKCVDGLKKLELYHARYDKKRQVFLKEPVHDINSNAADAMRTEATSEDVGQDGFYDVNNIKIISSYDIWE